MLNVCHLLSGDLWAGAEVMAHHLLKGLRAYEDLSLSVIVLNEGKLARELRKSGIAVHIVDEKRLSFFDLLFAVRRILEKRPPDVIHSHRYKENSLACLLLASSHTSKLVGTQHGMPETDRGKRGLKYRLISRCNFSLLSTFFHRTVAVSQNMRQTFLERYRFREDRVRVIHNGIEIPKKTSQRDNGRAFVVGSAGRLSPVKDYPLMVDIAKVISKKIEGIRFRLAGDGPEKQRLRSLIDHYGLSEIFELEGHLDDVSSFYEDLDLYLNTSVHEGIPMSILEAMSYGLPVVAPKVGGLKEIVQDGIQGYLLKERRPEEFAGKCLLLYEDRSLRQEMSRAAGERVVQSFSLESMARRYYDMYIELVQSR